MLVRGVREMVAPSPERGPGVGVDRYGPLPPPNLKSRYSYEDGPR